jgi:hypothetical protein
VSFIGELCPISNNGFAIGIGYLINFTDCVLDIAGFIFRLSTQGKVEERLNKFAVSKMGSLFVHPFGAYHGFLHSGLLQIGKLLKQGFPVAQLNSSLYLSHK